MKNNNWIKAIEKIFLKIKSIIDFLAIVSVFGILLYRIKTLKKICKEICQYIVDWYVDIDLLAIKNIYLWCENIFRIIIVFFLALTVLMWIIRLIWECWLKKQKGKDRFEESIFRYLRDWNIPRCFLVTGKWGVGKTYEVQRFFDKYYRYSKTKVFRISCFGLGSRKDLVKEISNTIEQKDNSFYALIIKVLQFLPIIGEPIGKFLKKSYGYDSVQKGSVFIFDDFERITSKAIVNDHPSHLYEESSFLLNDVTHGRNQIKEFKEIKKEFNSIEKSFFKVEDFVVKSLEREDFDKYNIVTGLINDIIEMYGMKVIIICNPEILGEKFIHDILRSKLNCIEYRKTISFQTRISMINGILNDKIFEDTEKHEIIKEYLDYIKSNIKQVMLDINFDNLRLFGGLLEAFLITATMFEKDVLTKDFLNSLFNSIIIAHRAFYNKAIEHLDMFITGANIDFLMRIFYGESPNLIRLNRNVEEVKWIDISISGYWILNLSFPQNISNIVSTWKNYKYCQTEEKMCENRQNLMLIREYDLLHIFYYQSGVDVRNNEEWDYQSYIDNALKVYDLTKIETVQSILDIMGIIFRGSIYQEFYIYLFGKLAQGHETETIVGDTYIHNMYKTFIQKGTLH